MTNSLSSEIVKEYGLSAGASIVGIAASSDFDSAPDGFKPKDVLGGCRSVIVLGSPHPREALKNSVDYTDCRNAMLSKMTDIAQKTAKRIMTAGYKAKAISGSGGKYLNGEHFGHISLKHAAELAGLGVIGKNYLLISPEYGTLLWLSAVLTDADLIPDKKAQISVCGSCNKCVEVCPSKALGNSTSFGKKECAKFFTMENKKFAIKCFLCRTVCPYRFGIKAEE